MKSAILYNKLIDSLTSLIITFSLLFSIVSLVVVWYSLPLEVIIIGRIVEGISGGIPILLASSFAYIVDTVPSGTLSLRLALIDMIIGLCGGTGGLVSGYLLEAVGYASVYLCSVGLYLFNFGSGPDPDLPGEGMRSIEYRPAQGGGHRWYMFFLLLAFMTYAMLLQGVPNLLILVQLNAPLCWDAVLMGYGIAVSCTGFLASFLAVALLRRRLTPPGAALLGLLSFSVGMVLLSFTSTTLMMFLAQIPLLLRVMPAPLMRSMMSNAVLPTEQGTLFSMVSCLQTFSEILATIIFNNVYAATVATFHGFSFILAVAISVIPATIMGYVVCYKMSSQSSPYKCWKVWGTVHNPDKLQ
uniref:Lysosomal proton-coupled steroid conjugate and bile acid symporter SLC46A3 n=1 Tax=Eptatretus burgeri TaxID=7764 RepID=A0A8C4QMB0_EPTBU